MKITKSRLKEIIREELSIVRESDLPSWDGAPFEEYDLDAENAQGMAAAEQEYIVKIGAGTLSARDLDAAVLTAKNWQEMGLDLLDGTSPEVLDALNAESEM